MGRPSPSRVRERGASEAAGAERIWRWLLEEAAHIRRARRAAGRTGATPWEGLLKQTAESYMEDKEEAPYQQILADRMAEPSLEQKWVPMLDLLIGVKMQDTSKTSAIDSDPEKNARS